MDKKLETLHELCEIVSRELEELQEKIRKAGGQMSAGDLEMLDKLTHTLKSLKTTIAMMEADDGYSGRAYMPTYYGGRSYADGNGMGGGNSYARGRSNVRRDSTGRYSRGGYSYDDGMTDLLEQMRGMIQELPEEKRRKAQRLMDELEH